MEQKKIVFLTGTRADFGKLKSLIEITNSDSSYEVELFVTGMHLQSKYGSTVDEIVKCGYPNIYKFINHTSERSMDQNLAKTIQGFSDFVRESKPHLIVIHGDRVEALAGAIVGSLNNILVAHVEGGEVSGTIDELIRHAVSKMSHTHFVSNAKAKKRLIQMGELEESIFEIGSPDVDVMVSENLPSISEVKNRYDIEFEEYGIVSPCYN
jgi:UDP-N-acetylglucosamine 2-epimerase (hydrolysing)